MYNIMIVEDDPMARRLLEIMVLPMSPITWRYRWKALPLRKSIA